MEVLIVDDYNIIVEGIKRELTNIFPDSICHGFTSGKEALDFAFKNIIDVAILDIELPDIDGITLARRLIGIHPNINIIFATGHEQYALEAHELYASAFLMKPIDRASLKDAFTNLRRPICSISDKNLSDNFMGQNTIGSNITRYRENIHLSRKELSDLMNVTPQTIHRWEKGDRIPDVITFMNLARILGVSTELLMQ